MNTTTARRMERGATMTLNATPVNVFPLLCPVREYDWIPHWRCNVLHSASGVAEKDCVFSTEFPERGREVWICTRYEAPRAIEYVRWSDRGMLTRLTLTLAEDGPGRTQLLWNSARFALSPEAEDLLDALDAGGYEQEVTLIESMLAHYLETGTALQG